MDGYEIAPYPTGPDCLDGYGGGTGEEEERGHSRASSLIEVL